MILIKNLSSEIPFQIFYKKYKYAIECCQKNIDAACVSSYSKSKNEVNSRFVNIKYLIKKEFIFFSNYESIKAEEFAEHSQVSATFFWNEVNTQIRIKARVEKTLYSFNQEHFSKRNKEKNALAVSSKQSKQIDSYNKVKENYNKSLKNDDLKECPEYWGGYSFTPYFFEFWDGHKSRINKREVFEKIDGVWERAFLQP